MPQNSTLVASWWAALSAIAALNMMLWFWSKGALERSRQSRSPDEQAWWRRQQRLSAVFVFGCAFRSFLPRADVQRICLYNSWLSSVLVGRAVATAAELCFMAQLALHLRRLAQEKKASAAAAISRVIVPVIVAAEICSWYAVVTTNYLGNTMEESLWTLAAALLLAGCADLWRLGAARLRRLLAFPMAVGAGYLAFMTTVDVPMYFSRWRADETAGRAYLGLAAGLRDLARRWVVTFRWQDWRTEIPWMTLYFSAAVWLSLALAAPALADFKARRDAL